MFGKSRLFLDPWRDGADTTLYAIQVLLRLPTKLVRPNNQEASRVPKQYPWNWFPEH